jgi:hypothetical protein
LKTFLQILEIEEDNKEILNRKNILTKLVSSQNTSRTQLSTKRKKVTIYITLKKNSLQPPTPPPPKTDLKSKNNNLGGTASSPEHLKQAQR